ncbi:MAG: hypothetical protein WC251_02695, partial [Candidatus Izemoplasmatales bacterium]
NLGANWWEAELGLVGADFYGKDNPHLFDASSSIYFYVGGALGLTSSGYRYIQLVILDEDLINATRILPSE